VTHRIDGLQEKVEELLHGYKGAAVWLAQHDTARQHIWELQWALIDERQKLGSSEWMHGGPLLEKVDHFLAIFYGQGVAETEARPPWELPRIGYLR